MDSNLKYTNNTGGVVCVHFSLINEFAWCKSKTKYKPGASSLGTHMSARSSIQLHLAYLYHQISYHSICCKWISLHLSRPGGDASWSLWDKNIPLIHHPNRAVTVFGSHRDGNGKLGVLRLEISLGFVFLKRKLRPYFTPGQSGTKSLSVLCMYLQGPPLLTWINLNPNK